MGLSTVLYKSQWEKWRDSSIKKLVVDAELLGAEKTPQREMHLPSVRVRHIQSWDFLNNPEKEAGLTTTSHAVYTLSFPTYYKRRHDQGERAEDYTPSSNAKNY